MLQLSQLHCTIICHRCAVESSATLAPAHTPYFFSIDMHTVRQRLVIARFFAFYFVWSSIPNDVWCAQSLSPYKSRLETYLFRPIYEDLSFYFDHCTCTHGLAVILIFSGLKNAFCIKKYKSLFSFPCFLILMHLCAMLDCYFLCNAFRFHCNIGLITHSLFNSIIASYQIQCFFINWFQFLCSDCFIIKGVCAFGRNSTSK